MNPLRKVSVIVAVLIALLAVPTVATASDGDHVKKPKRAFRQNGQPKKRTYVRPSVDKHGHHRNGHYAKE